MPISRPAPSEYDDYYEGYVSKVDGGGGALEQLEAQITATRSMLSGLDDERARHRYQPGKWSVKEVLGHLVDTERVFSYRAMCIARGERASLPGMEQDDYVAGGRFDDRGLASLLEEFEHQRRATIALFASLDAESLHRTGVANNSTISVRALAFIIAGHHAHHLGVLSARYLG
jgi:hypothetical protein